ncbi:hypothetical protein DXG03_000259 [Asterophora parasitica]|uniref:Uncharacterized protein n=1 Tax=Asterophora parasitica TaxID=117018 RepID=A0A9P7GKD9_9AGAR|nr:hypothetical protein DXG03_000259 [Asterophora parasitica]
MASSEPRPPSTAPSTPQSFDGILAAADLPPPGPDYYAARRSLWLTPRQTAQIAQAEPSTSRQRLEHLLSLSNDPEDEYIWKNGVGKVWTSLDAGGRFKRRLPLAMIIRVIHAAWVRDDTWPKGAVAPEPDDVLTGPPVTHIYSPIATEYPSSATTSRLASNDDDADADDNSKHSAC